MTDQLRLLCEQLERENQQLQLRVEQAERYRLHVETACKVGTATYTQMLANDLQRQRDLTEEQNRKIELLSKQIAEKDEALKKLLPFAIYYGSHPNRKDDDLEMRVGQAQRALSTTGSDYIHKDEVEIGITREQQDQIRNCVIKHSGAPDGSIDGAGCDSGDPLDFTCSEIAMGIAFVKDKSQDELSQFKEKCRGIVQKLKLIEHATNDAFGSGQGAYHENALQAAREAIALAKELGLIDL